MIPEFASFFSMTMIAIVDYSWKFTGLDNFLTPFLAMDSRIFAIKCFISFQRMIPHFVLGDSI